MRKGYWVIKNDDFDLDNNGSVDELTFTWECDYNSDAVRLEADNLIETPDEISFNLSMEKSFYFIEDIDFNNQSLDITGDQWIVSYCGENIVGSRH